MSIQYVSLSSFIGVFCCLSLMSAPAWSEEPQVTQRAAPATTAAAPLKSSSPGLGAPIKESRLAEMRGGDVNINVHSNKQELSGKVGNNSATNVQTGSNTITDGSFANSNGLPIVIQNSGNGVLIQNSTILNLNVK